MPIPDIQFNSRRQRGEGEEAVLRTAKLARRILVISMVLVAIGYVVSNYTVLDANEQAFISQFGAVKGDALKPGKGYYALPKPFASVVRVRTARSHTVVASFWYEEAAANQQGPPPDPETLRTAADSYLLTGDYNVIHGRWSVNFTIDNLKRYHYGYAEGQADLMIQNALANAVVKEVAGTPIDSAIYEGSETLRGNVERRFKRKLVALDVGIDLSSINVYFDRREVPRQVLDAFTQVIEAENEYSSRRSGAHAFSRKLGQQAQGEASQILAEAESYNQRVRAGVEADADYFEKILPKYRTSRNTLLVTMFQETLQQMIAQARDVYYTTADQEIRLQLNRVPKDVAHDSEGAHVNR